jgi:hypothetical protein
MDGRRHITLFSCKVVRCEGAVLLVANPDVGGYSVQPSPSSAECSDDQFKFVHTSVIAALPCAGPVASTDMVRLHVTLQKVVKLHGCFARTDGLCVCGWAHHGDQGREWLRGNNSTGAYRVFGLVLVQDGSANCAVHVYGEQIWRLLQIPEGKSRDELLDTMRARSDHERECYTFRRAWPAGTEHRDIPLWRRDMWKVVCAAESESRCVLYARQLLQEVHRKTAAKSSTFQLYRPGKAKVMCKMNDKCTKFQCNFAHYDRRRAQRSAFVYTCPEYDSTGMCEKGDDCVLEHTEKDVNLRGMKTKSLKWVPREENEGSVIEFRVHPRVVLQCVRVLPLGGPIKKTEEEPEHVSMISEGWRYLQLLS